MEFIEYGRKLREMSPFARAAENDDEMDNEPASRGKEPGIDGESENLSTSTSILLGT